MPIIEYRCTECGEMFENLQSSADEGAVACPKCGSANVERLLSVFAVTGPRRGPAPGPCGSADCACRRP